jgi:GTP-binding protein EngB required for normal cell division
MLKPLQKLRSKIKKNRWAYLLAATLIVSSYILLSDNKQLPTGQATSLIQKIKDHDKEVRAVLEEHDRLINLMNDLAKEIQNLGKKKAPLPAEADRGA